MKTFDRIISLLFLMSLLFSCKETNRERISHLVKEWDGKEIKFPDNPVFTRLAEDTVPYTILKTDYKVVVFVDSLGCISCKLQLPKWKEFMHEVDSLSDGGVPFIFFFQTKDVGELKYIFRRDDFSHPVCIDTEDSFNKLNCFSTEMMFQTFLVDSNNCVKVIGNPIHNLSVKDLYLKEIAGLEVASLPVTMIQADSVEYHYGVINENKAVSKVIFLKNTGKEVFRIKGVTTSCDCMVVEYDRDEIPSGGELAMTVKYTAEESGDFWRTLTIYGNVPGKSITLDFWGTARK